jgi:germination protein M
MKRALTLLVVVSLLVFGAACGGDDDDDGATTTSGATAPASIASTSSTEPGTEAAVRVYFAWNEKVGTAGRTVDASAVEEDSVEALLGGPDSFETDIGMTTQIPEGTELLGLTIAGGEATVDLSGEFQSGGGSLSMELRAAQVVFTLIQFDSVETVTIHLDGNEVEGIGGEGIPATELTRRDFENVTPLILVESPVPGAAVTSPLVVAGISNTFEANVRYSVTDPEGLILDEGFTTATAGTGTWGEFSFTVEFATDRTGLGAVIVFQDDMNTGEPRDVYEVPVRIG